MAKEYVVIRHWSIQGGDSEQFLIQTNIGPEIKRMLKAVNVASQITEDGDDVAFFAYTYPWSDLGGVQSHLTGLRTALEIGKGFDLQDTHLVSRGTAQPGELWRYERNVEK